MASSPPRKLKLDVLYTPVASQPVQPTAIALTRIIGSDSIRKTFQGNNFTGTAPEVAADMPKKSSPRRKGTKGRPIFEGLRKPLAPPGHPMSHAKPEEKARPAGRKAKHKLKPQEAYVLEDAE